MKYLIDLLPLRVSVSPWFIVLLFLFSTIAPAAAPTTKPSSPDESQILSRLPAGIERELIKRALARADGNKSELLKFLIQTAPDQIDGAIFLLACMPEKDLRSLKSTFLQSNLAYAYKAWKGSPWAHQVPPQIFLQYILPYAQLDERRDDWRKDFFDRFSARAWQCKSPQDAALKLNDWVTQEFGVTFHATKRSKPNQSPSESIAEKFASCTGLSILYADACRAVGLPARLVGVPAWSKTPGNHNWVEIWAGQWWCQGSIGMDPRDGDWVTQRCKTETDATQPAHSVYAAVFRPSPAHFPLAWDLSRTYIPADNVTKFYKNLTRVPLKFPANGADTIRVYWGSEIVAEKPCTGTIDLYLAGAGESYRLVFLQHGKPVDTQPLDVK